MKWQSIYFFIVLFVTGCIGGTHPKTPETTPTPMEVSTPETGNTYSIGSKVYDGLPWVVDNKTGEVIIRGVQNAWYFRHMGQLQITYELDEPGNELHGRVVEEMFDIEDITLMTPKGPCTIQGDTFTCPTDE